MRIVKPNSAVAEHDSIEEVRPVETVAVQPPAVLEWPGSAIMADPVTARVLFTVWSGDAALVVPAPPGAGKTRLVCLLAAALAHRAGLRVGVAAQTRAQAVEIAGRLGALSDRAALVWKAKVPQPTLPGRGKVVTGPQVRWPARGGGVLVATTARWLYSDPRVLEADVLIVDEAWQCTYADLGALGAFARQIVCVGDPGQIDPVVTGDVSRWQASATAPNLPAPDALLAAHGDAVGVVRLRHTWRLGPVTTKLLQPVFYPTLPFTSMRPDERITLAGNAIPELSRCTVRVTGGPTDGALLDGCADRVRQLLGGELETTSGTRQLVPADIAVVVPHVTQAASIRARLADVPEVLVGTANSLQGLERAAVVALHPLAGYRTVEPFSIDRGRMCVALSRHRAHLTVFTDAATAQVLDSAGDPMDGLREARRLHEAITDLPPV